MMKNSMEINLRNSIKVQYSNTKDYYIHTSIEWSCRKMNMIVIEKTRNMLSGVGL